MIERKLKEVIEEMIERTKMFADPLIVLPILIDCYIKLRKSQEVE